MKNTIIDKKNVEYIINHKDGIPYGYKERDNTAAKKEGTIIDYSNIQIQGSSAEGNGDGIPVESSHLNSFFKQFIDNDLYNEQLIYNIRNSIGIPGPLVTTSKKLIYNSDDGKKFALMSNEENNEVKIGHTVSRCETLNGISSIPDLSAQYVNFVIFDGEKYVAGTRNGLFNSYELEKGWDRVDEEKNDMFVIPFIGYDCKCCYYNELQGKTNSVLDNYKFFLGTNNGLYGLNITTEFPYWDRLLTSKIVSDITITSIVANKYDNRLYVGTNNGVFIYPDEEEVLKTHNLHINDITIIDDKHQIDAKSEIFIGTDQGIKQSTQILVGNNISKITPTAVDENVENFAFDDNGYLKFFTTKNSLYEISYDHGSNITAITKIYPQHLKYILFVKNNLAVITDDDHLKIFNKTTHALNNTSISNVANIKFIKYLKDINLFIAVQQNSNNTCTIYYSAFKNFNQPIAHTSIAGISSINSITTDNNKYIFISTTHGLYILTYDITTGFEIIFAKDTSLFSTITFVKKIDNHIFIGTNVGLYEYNAEDNNYVKKLNSLNAQIYSITKNTSSNTYYIFTSSGVYQSELPFETKQSVEITFSAEQLLGIAFTEFNGVEYRIWYSNNKLYILQETENSNDIAILSIDDLQEVIGVSNNCIYVKADNKLYFYKFEEVIKIIREITKNNQFNSILEEHSVQIQNKENLFAFEYFSDNNSTTGNDYAFISDKYLIAKNSVNEYTLNSNNEPLLNFDIFKFNNSTILSIASTVTNTYISDDSEEVKSISFNYPFNTIITTKNEIVNNIAILETHNPNTEINIYSPKLKPSKILPGTVDKWYLTNSKIIQDDNDNIYLFDNVFGLIKLIKNESSINCENTFLTLQYLADPYDNQNFIGSQTFSDLQFFDDLVYVSKINHAYNLKDQYTGGFIRSIDLANTTVDNIVLNKVCSDEAYERLSTCNCENFVINETLLYEINGIEIDLQTPYQINFGSSQQTLFDDVTTDENENIYFHGINGNIYKLTSKTDTTINVENSSTSIDFAKTCFSYHDGYSLYINSKLTEYHCFIDNIVDDTNKKRASLYCENTFGWSYNKISINELYDSSDTANANNEYIKILKVFVYNDEAICIAYKQHAIVNHENNIIEDVLCPVIYKVNLDAIQTKYKIYTALLSKHPTNRYFDDRSVFYLKGEIYHFLIESNPDEYNDENYEYIIKASCNNNLNQNVSFNYFAGEIFDETKDEYDTNPSYITKLISNNAHTKFVAINNRKQCFITKRNIFDFELIPDVITDTIWIVNDILYFITIESNTYKFYKIDLNADSYNKEEIIINTILGANDFIQNVLDVNGETFVSIWSNNTEIIAFIENNTLVEFNTERATFVDSNNKQRAYCTKLIVAIANTYDLYRTEANRLDDITTGAGINFTPNAINITRQIIDINSYDLSKINLTTSDFVSYTNTNFNSNNSINTILNLDVFNHNSYSKSLLIGTNKEIYIATLDIQNLKYKYAAKIESLRKITCQFNDSTLTNVGIKSVGAKILSNHNYDLIFLFENNKIKYAENVDLNLDTIESNKFVDLEILIPTNVNPFTVNKFARIYDGLYLCTNNGLYEIGTSIDLKQTNTDHELKTATINYMVLDDRTEDLVLATSIGLYKINDINIRQFDYNAIQNKPINYFAYNSNYLYLEYNNNLLQLECNIENGTLQNSIIIGEKNTNSNVNQIFEVDNTVYYYDSNTNLYTLLNNFALTEHLVEANRFNVFNCECKYFNDKITNEQNEVIKNDQYTKYIYSLGFNENQFEFYFLSSNTLSVNGEYFDYDIENKFAIQTENKIKDIVQFGNDSVLLISNSDLSVYNLLNSGIYEYSLERFSQFIQQNTLALDAIDYNSVNDSIYIGFDKNIYRVYDLVYRRCFVNCFGEYEILNSRFKLQNTLQQYKLDDTHFIVGTDNSIRYINDLKMCISFIDYKTSKVLNGQTTKILSCEINEVRGGGIKYIYTVGNSIYSTTDLFTHIKEVTIPNITRINDIYAENDVCYYVSTNNGLYLIRLDESFEDDLHKYNVLDLKNETREFLSTYIDSHIRSYHTPIKGTDNLLLSLDNKMPTTLIDFPKSFTTNTFVDLYDANQVIEEDIVKSIEFNDENQYIKAAFKNWTTTRIKTTQIYSYGSYYDKFTDPSSGKEFDLSKLTYIVKLWNSGLKEFNIYVPSTCTYYINNPKGFTNSKYANSSVVPRINVSGNYNSSNIISDKCTSLKILINNNHYNIKHISSILINGMSLPLKMYKDDSYCMEGREGKFDTVIQPSVCNTLPIVMDENVNNIQDILTDDGYLVLYFSIYGTDAQAIRIIAE